VPLHAAVPHTPSAAFFFVLQKNHPGIILIAHKDQPYITKTESQKGRGVLKTTI
jgi:hypothetical protein